MINLSSTMTIPETDDGSALGAGSREKRMKAVQCWEGSNGNLKRSQMEAAADIIGSAQSFDVMKITDTPIPSKSESIRDAVFWLADELRKKKPKTKRARR